ncbi:type VI secretion system Vgr family protein [Enterobacter chuandaensis]|uniref:Type VI secretion system Vgr family protein n=1 Tax=Enterobacter chuandaensis TaxID=2497875 RepID=A0AA96M0D7_9ENTR|nr:type VI secretion system Vgr family protein [Enterobacter chuandaensis]MCW4782289.1 type VI secretion system tip protein VgrG [Enterobacter chuandaensis]MDA4757388.1 type VI secretion system tip protein VgrG [Enterobacter chuandaensis]WNS36346.1 type VI secretion system tip protein VgrG [Enterobacter chuandaensis]
MDFADAMAGTGQSRYSLHIHDSRAEPDVLRFRGREALSEPFSWRIEFTVAQDDIDGTDVLKKYATFRMSSGKTVEGVITSFEALGTSADQSLYAVRLESRLALLSHTRRCAIYQNVSVPELVETILRAHGLEGSDFEFRLEHTYPVRELITQWRETDLQFIQRLLSETGIWFRCGLNDTTGLDTVIFADSQLYYTFNVTLPFHEPAGLYDGAEESAWGLRTWYKVVTGQVQTRSHNYCDAAMPMDSVVAVRNGTSTTGEHYHYGDNFLNPGDDHPAAIPETESGAFYARLHHERELNKSSRFHIFSNASHLAPGQVLETPGSGFSDLREGMVITLTTFIASRDSRLHTSVWGIPYTERYCYRPPAIPRPEIFGTLPARVESRDAHDPYSHLDETGRYRVKLDFSREDAEPGFSYLWIRQAKPYAGDTYGWHMPLVDGTEVAIAFNHGDPDKPYIAHAFHDSEHADVVNRDNRSQNILRTAGANELRMEDKRQEEHIALSTLFGATQLNQGHITDAQGEQRGSGFELRTDEHGVIRVAKGLFITADGQQKAVGDILDMDTALREIELLQQQLRALNSAAVQARALEADITSQQAMFAERFRELEEMIHFHGPEGVAFTSGEHMQLTAAGNIAMNAGGDISTGSMGNTTLLAGESLGLFAHTGKLSLISAEGPVQVQAQNGAMHISAEQKLSILSMSEILFAGKKRVTLIGGGSYLKIDPAGIEYGTTNTYTRYAKRTVTAGPATVPVEFPSHPEPGEPVISPDDHLFS